MAGFFARRCSEPQTVADLTSETSARAVGSFDSFHRGRGSARAWLFGIARRVYARHYQRVIDARDAAGRLASQLTLDDDEIEELAARIDAQRAGRGLLERCARLPELDRKTVELVDLSGLKPQEAALALGMSAGALRVRLFGREPGYEKEQSSHDEF